MIPHNLVSLGPICNASPVSAATPPHGLFFSELHCNVLHWIAHLCWIVLHSLTLQRIGLDLRVDNKQQSAGEAGVRFPIPGYKHCFHQQQISKPKPMWQNQSEPRPVLPNYLLISTWFDMDPHTLPCYPLHQKQDDAFSEARGCKYWFWSERDIWDLQQQRWVRWGFRKSRPWPRAHLGAGGDL